jgi:uncharacterized surface protein with fasciclin (FAS1) repeats
MKRVAIILLRTTALVVLGFGIVAGAVYAGADEAIKRSADKWTGADKAVAGKDCGAMASCPVSAAFAVAEADSCGDYAMTAAKDGKDCSEGECGDKASAAMAGTCGGAVSATLASTDGKDCSEGECGDKASAAMAGTCGGDVSATLASADGKDCSEGECSDKASAAVAKADCSDCDKACGACPSSMDAVTAAAQDPSLSMFVLALHATGLADTVRSHDDVTMLAVPNEVFTSLPREELAALLSDTKALRAALMNHIADQRVAEADARDASELVLVSGLSAPLASMEGCNTLTVHDAKVTQTDIAAANGYIHKVDRLILPADESEETLTASADTQGEGTA